jgi:hypothetical protein
MKRMLLAACAALLVSAGSGCLQHNVCRNDDNCSDCGCGNGSLLGHLMGGRVAAGIHESQGWRHQAPELGPPGPPTGAYAYPYYTLRGPRDFLADNPPSIGN